MQFINDHQPDNWPIDQLTNQPTRNSLTSTSRSPWTNQSHFFITFWRITWFVLYFNLYINSNINILWLQEGICDSIGHLPCTKPFYCSKLANVPVSKDVSFTGEKCPFCTPEGCFDAYCHESTKNCEIYSWCMYYFIL